MKTKIIQIITLSAIITSFAIENIDAQNLQRVINLRGKWRFTIGDNKAWSQFIFDDSNWESIYVPAAWEDQGFYGYDGMAWYRKSFVITSDYKNSDLFLYLGYIDDVDEVYFNGHFIGMTGTFPPNYSTAYNTFRKYYIPKEYVNFDRPNLIAVRVYDSQLEGGIINGDVGVYADTNPIPYLLNLQGTWKFRIGNSEEFAKLDYNDFNWRNITVPRTWEDQGYNDYDGFAWYRKKFDMPSTYNSEKLVLMLGKIDDFEEVYINGTYVGPMKKIAESLDNDQRYSEERVYYFDGSILKAKNNVIAVKVFDKGGVGGIYVGPVGILKLKDFLKYWRAKR
jgi:sialate O-acetylesterase